MDDMANLTKNQTHVSPSVVTPSTQNCSPKTWNWDLGSTHGYGQSPLLTDSQSP